MSTTLSGSTDAPQRSYSRATAARASAAVRRASGRISEPVRIGERREQIVGVGEIADGGVADAEIEGDLARESPRPGEAVRLEVCAGRGWRS